MSEYYQLVFKMFDKDNTGEISIKHVYDMINQFDQREKDEDWRPGDPVKMEEDKEEPPKSPSKEPKVSATREKPGYMQAIKQDSPSKREARMRQRTKCKADKPEGKKSPGRRKQQAEQILNYGNKRQVEKD